MSRNEERHRVVIAITETSPVDALWRAALRRLGQSGTEVLALFVAEDHWHRAASLPFTREISRVSGADVDFTRQRARQVHEEAITRARRLVSKLAADANLKTAFEVLSGTDVEKTRELLAVAHNVLIAPSLVSRRPFLAQFEKLGCRIELVEDRSFEAGDETGES